MNDMHALSRVMPGSLTTEYDNEDEYLTIFAKFRDLTRPEWCRSRKVYYLEEGFGGRVRLRQVTKLPRKDKGDDAVLSIMKGPFDLDVVKAHIANANINQVLSGVRWELYGDYELTELIEQGRFDIIDLLPPDRDRIERLTRSGNLNVDLKKGALDFDNFLPVHTCPACHAYKFGLDLLVYEPEWMRCSACHYTDRQFIDMKAVFDLNRLLKYTKPALSATLPADAPIEMGFVELVATPALTRLIRKSVIPFGGVFREGMPYQLTVEDVYRLYDHSLFKLLRTDTIRAAFIASMNKHFERRLAAFRAGKVPAFFKGSGMDEEICKRRIEEWEKSREEFGNAAELLAHLDEFLFDQQPFYTSARAKDYWKMILAISDFPLYLEDLLDVLWTDHCAPKIVTLPEVIHE